MARRGIHVADRRPQLRAVDLGGRVPPHNGEAEAAVLSAVLADGRALDTVLGIVGPEAFYSDANKRILEAAVELHQKGTPVDVATVGAWLKDRDRLQAIGGVSYLASIVDSTPAIAHVGAHAAIVAEKARVRRLIETCQLVAAEGFGDYGDAQTFVDDAERRIFAIAHDAGEKRADVLVYDLVVDSGKRLELDLQRLQEGKRVVDGIPTGLADLDAQTAGMHGGELIIVAARPGMGKGQRLTDRILTPTGWRTFGDLAVGDRVIGSDGSATTVRAIYDRGALDVYRVTMDDGASMVCDGDHLWLTRNRAERRAGLPGRPRETRVVAATLSRADSGGLNHSIQYVKPVRFERVGPLPLDPYLLGVMLGDGSHSGSTPQLHNPESDIRDRVRAALPSGDSLSGDHPVSVRIVGCATARALAELGLQGCRSWEKFIPGEYLWSTVEDRIALLRGLCDTDGFVTMPSRRSVEYCTASKRLAEDLEFLVRSLGGTVSKKVRPTHYVLDGERHEARNSWRLVLSFPSGDVVPVSSRKHLAKWQTGKHRVADRFISSVESVGVAEVRCIEVDAIDHLYVTEDFIVTHNTSYALDIARSVAARVPEDDPGDCLFGVMIFSLEMPRDQLTDRMLSQAGKVNSENMRTRRFTAGEHDALTRAMNDIGALPIWIDDTPNVSVFDIRAKARRRAAEFEQRRPDGTIARRLGLIVIDYLQLMRGEGDSREQEVASITRALKQLAKELNVPIIALAQLSRKVEERGKDKRPMLSDLRESGAIEQDADVVQFLFRPFYYLPPDEQTSPQGQRIKTYAEVIVAKQRNGPTGRVKVTFLEECTRFEDRARDAASDDGDDAPTERRPSSPRWGRRPDAPQPPPAYAAPPPYGDNE